jgi:hypothetical protein
MSRVMRRCVVTLSLCVVFPWLAEAQGYHWTQVKIPGAFDTVAAATNDAGWVVGNWHGRDGNAAAGAFRYQKGTFLDFRVPGAVQTWPEGMAKASLIAGSYEIPSASGDGGMEHHGFLYIHTEGGRFVTLDYPGAFWTFATGVNDRRQVVGQMYFEDRWSNFLYDHATQTYTEIAPPPGVFYIVLHDINNHGDVAGYAAVPLDPNQTTDDATWQGIVRWDDEWLLLAVPGAVFTTGDGLNDLGQVVGSHVTSPPNDAILGWMYDLRSGRWTIFTPPGKPSYLWVKDIDNQGRIVAAQERISDGYTMSQWIRPKVSQPGKTVQAR